MTTRCAATVTILFVLLLLALTPIASAHESSPRQTPAARSQALFIDLASEGYRCNQGVCAFPPGNVGSTYAASITSGGGQGPTPYTWSVVAGRLPAGLSLTPSYGVYSAYVYGTPTTLQTSTFTLQVRDGVGHTARQAFTLTIKPPPPLVITFPTTCCTAGKVGTSYFQNFFASGGIQPYTWSISTGQIPPGLTFTTQGYGHLAGTPTSAGVFTFTVDVTDSRGVHATEAGRITIHR